MSGSVPHNSGPSDVHENISTKYQMTGAHPPSSVKAYTNTEKDHNIKSFTSLAFGIYDIS